MSIVTSKIIERRVQIDGRVYITEQHTTETGVVVPVEYLAEATEDHEARMHARVPELEAALVTAAEEAAAERVRQDATTKLDAWLLTSPDLIIKTELGVTDSELDALRIQHGKVKSA